MGWLLFNSFFEARKRTQVIAARAESRKHADQVVVNAPDARFFNAALRLFGRSAGQGGLSNWHRFARRAERSFISTGHVPPMPDPALAAVLDAMRKEDLLPVCSARRSVHVADAHLVNHDLSTPLTLPGRRTPHHVLPTLKTRGLRIRKERHQHRKPKGMQL